MNKATNKMAMRIAGLLKGFDRKTPVEQMVTYLTVGEKLACMVEDEREYGSKAVADVVSLVPQLKTEEYAYGIMNLSRRDDEAREFMLKETATPMGDGKPLALGHWLWLARHQPDWSEAERDAWLGRELAWLRKESPSAAVLEHVEAVQGAEYQREVDEIRKSVEDAIGVLESV